MEVNKSQMELLDEAIDTEKKGYEFYLESASRFEDERARVLFRSLAEDELQHMRFLQEGRKRAELQQDWAEGITKRIESVEATRMRPSIFPDDPKKAAKLAAPNATLVQALETGVRNERGSYKFYSEAAKKAQNADVRAAYESLARWEHQHLVDLDDYSEYLTNPASYWAKHDRPIMEG